MSCFVCTRCGLGDFVCVCVCAHMHPCVCVRVCVFCPVCLHCLGLFFILSPYREGKVVFGFIVLFFPSYSCVNELEEVVLIAVYVCFTNVSMLCEAHGKATIPCREKPPLLIPSAVFFSSVTEPEVSSLWKQSAVLALPLFFLLSEPLFLSVFYLQLHIATLAVKDSWSKHGMSVCVWVGRSGF